MVSSNRPVGAAKAARSSRKLFQALKRILADPDLNLELSAYLEDLVVPAKVAQGRLSQEQASRLIDLSRETLENSCTPAERAAAAERARTRKEHSPFARLQPLVFA